MPKANRLTPEQKSKILELSSQGLSVQEIGAQMALEVNRVNGVVITARNKGVLDPPPPAPFPQQETPMPPEVQTPSPIAPQVVRPQVSAPMEPDGQAWRSAAPGQGETFLHPQQKVEYKIERISPRDGVLGFHQEPISDDDLGQTYGEGQYRVWKQEGNKPPLYREVLISKAYGDPRFPRPVSQTPDGRRPAARFPEGGDEGSHLPPRPRLSPSMYGVGERATLPPFTRPAPSNDLAAVALAKMAESHEKSLDRMAQGAASASAPAETMKDFFKEQQAALQARMDEERRRDEDRRRQDREEARQRETDREAQHRRDMDRIKAENDARIQADREARQGLLDIEKARMEAIKEESRAREAAMKADLEKIRLEAKEERQTLLEKMTEIEENAAAAIEAARKSINEELEKGRLSLTREFDLKEKHLEAESKLKEDLLKLREEIVKGQSGDETSKMIGKLVEGLERTVKEVVDLKKIEAATAESHLSQVGKRGVEPQPPAPALAAPVEQAPALRPSAEGGNGHTKTAEQKELQNMDNFVRQMSQDPFFQEVLTEWGKHVENGANASTFTNMFMEWMKDDGTPEGVRAQKACAVFVNHMQIRGWDEIYSLIQPAIPQAYREAFKLPHAAEFYAQFRLMVVSVVEDHWKAYLAAKQAEQVAAQQAKLEASKPAAPQPTRVSASPAPAS